MSDLFNIISVEEIEISKYIGFATINQEDIILKAHFPNMPIIPGVMLLNLIRKMVSIVTNKNLILTNADNVKFIKPIIPETNKIDITVEFNLTNNNSSYNVSAYLKYNSENIAKINSLTYSY
jgi:3-hydroxyacyl-[acyl-carrier-protein] dehydratase